MKVRAAVLDDRSAVLALVPRLAATGTPPDRDAAEVERGDLQSITQARGLFSQQPVGHVADIVVAEAAEGKGVGKHLMSAAEDWARTCGYTMVQLHVLVDNARARAMYERLGYSAEWLKYIKLLDVRPPE